MRGSSKLKEAKTEYEHLNKTVTNGKLLNMFEKNRGYFSPFKLSNKRMQ